MARTGRATDEALSPASSDFDRYDRMNIHHNDVPDRKQLYTRNQNTPLLQPYPSHVAFQAYPPPVWAYSRPRHHFATPAPVLHNLGYDPTPLFGWGSVTPLTHTYGQPGYGRVQKPDYRRCCFSVGKADVPYAAMPGGPLYGFPTTLSSQLVGRW